MSSESKDTPLEADFLNKTIEEWQPFSPRKLTREDARVIIDNVANFFQALIELDRFDESRNKKEDKAS